MKNKCRFDRTLRAFLDEEMPLGQRHTLHAHLTSCADCRTRLDALRAEKHLLRATLGAYPRIAASPDFDAGVWQKLAEREPQKLPFIESIDALFARPVLKLFASASGGFVFGLLLVTPYLFAKRTESAATSTSGARAASSLTSGFYARNEANLWLDFAPPLEPRHNS